MPRIDFHVIKQDKISTFHYLAQLVEKIYLPQKTIFIYTNSHLESQEIDRILWTADKHSFIPHHIYEPDALWAPVLISHDLIPKQKEVLINLSANIPDFYKEYTQIIEMVYGSEQTQQQARDKYKQYQHAKERIETHQIKESNG